VSHSPRAHQKHTHTHTHARTHTHTRTHAPVVGRLHDAVLALAPQHAPRERKHLGLARRVQRLKLGLVRVELLVLARGRVQLQAVRGVAASGGGGGGGGGGVSAAVIAAAGVGVSGGGGR
jgi:uncharacterized membrane protein YgcG